MNISIDIYTSGAYVAIRQQEVLQQTWRRSKPCTPVNDEALKTVLRRAEEGRGQPKGAAEGLKKGRGSRRGCLKGLKKCRGSRRGGRTGLKKSRGSRKGGQKGLEKGA